jgi:hypothetical protein
MQMQMQNQLQPKIISGLYSCNHCGKKHTRKTSHERHVLICELIDCSKREKKCESEETSDIPNHFQLYKIVQELALKNAILEEKMAEMQKWLNNKKKIDVVQWLIANRKVLLSFSEWQKTMIVKPEHIDLLIEENIVKAICDIITENIKPCENSCPIACFQQKTNLFYIFYEEGDQNGWKRATPDDFTLFIKHIHKKIWIEFTHWKQLNNVKIKSNSKMEDLCARTTIKLSGLNFDQDSAQMCKIRTHLYGYLKTDLKNMIDYDFQF